MGPSHISLKSHHWESAFFKLIFWSIDLIFCLKWIRCKKSTTLMCISFFYLYCNLFWRLKILFKFRCILSCLSKLPRASSDWSFWNIFVTTLVLHPYRTDTRNLHIYQGSLPWDFYILHFRCFQTDQME